MNSAKAICNYLNDQSGVFGFNRSHYSANLGNPYGTPVISSTYIHIWPLIGIFDPEQLQELFLDIPHMRLAEKRTDFSEDTDFLNLGTAQLLDTVGTLIITINDEEVDGELRLNGRGHHEIFAGTCRIVALLRLVEVKLYPSKEIYKLHYDTPGKFDDRIAKTLFCPT